MNFNNLKENHQYLAKFSAIHTSDKNDRWIFEVTKASKEKVHCQDVVIITGNTEIDNYTYHENDFNIDIIIIGEVSNKTHPEYYLWNMK